MARTVDDALKAKQRKQKIILGAGGLLLVALLAIQLPKLLGGDSTESSATTTTASSTPSTSSPAAAVTATGAAPAASSVTPGATVVVSKQTAVLAGVSVPRGFELEAGDGQLESFGRFALKDPFVQQVEEKEEPTAPAEEPKAAAQPQPDAGTQPGVVSGDAGAPSVVPSSSSGPAPKPEKVPPPAYATVVVNEVDAPVQPKTVFPQDEKLFVVKTIAKRSVTIGIAGGGSFASGKPTLKLERGRPVTLVNQATGTRYVLELVYVGTQPEQTASFTTDSGGAEQAAATSAGG
jgi:hypothetical protein